MQGPSIPRSRSHGQVCLHDLQHPLAGGLLAYAWCLDLLTYWQAGLRHGGVSVSEVLTGHDGLGTQAGSMRHTHGLPDMPVVLALLLVMGPVDSIMKIDSYYR